MRAKDVAAEIGPGLAKAAVAAVVDGKTVGLDTPLPGDGEIALKILTKKDAAALGVMRHSCAHVMARAVMRLFDGVQLAFGPTVGSGFYYDMMLPRSLTEDDFPAIEAEMAKIVKADEAFERLEEPRDKALQLCQELGQQFKVEHINTGLKDHKSMSFYRQGEFIDLCRGPHVPAPVSSARSSSRSVAGAYWKGDQTREQLQRLYGTAWFTKEDLDNYLAALEEAKRRDHRVLGKHLELFATNPLVGSGLVLWLPKGRMVRGLLEQFVKEELVKRGYEPVYTPNIGKIDLYKISGHFPYYADSQFKPIVMSEDEQYLLKPMNCPHHIMIYKSKPRSYRELPVRLAEFGTVYRYEQSGELGGMTRVRGFTQDDAHIFCTEDQVADEVSRLHRFHANRARLAGPERLPRAAWLPRSDERTNTSAAMPPGTKPRRQFLRWPTASNLPHLTVERGEAAFYGPKIDFVVRDCLGRDWQLGTVQVDYNLPSKERFDLEYIGADNQPHKPVMIHRAPLGSLERFVGVLIEHFAGAFPLWLAPEQVRVLTVSEKSEEYGRRVEAELKSAGLRVTGDYRAEKLGAKVRDAQLQLIPYMFVVGPKDAEAGTVSIRDRLEGDKGRGAAVGSDRTIARGNSHQTSTRFEASAAV